MDESQDESKIPEPVLLTRQTSVEVVNNWIKAASGNSISKDFEPAAEKCCVNRKLMAQTSVQHVFQYLDELADLQKLQLESREAFEQLVRECIRKAHPEEFTTHNQVDTFICPISQACPFEMTMALYDSFVWRRRYFHSALHELSSKLDTARLMGLFAEFGRAGSLCQAGKRFAFNLCMELVDPKSSQNEGGDGETNTKRILQQYMKKFMGEYINKAFRAAFMEPTWMCHFALDPNSCLGEVSEQHAVNVYAALITASVGVPVPIAYIDDEFGYGGCCSFLSCRNVGYQKAIKALIHPDNFGKSFRQVKECRDVKVSANSVHTQRFLFPAEMTPREQGMALLGGDPKFALERKLLVEYINNFMECFTVDFFVEKVFTRLNQDRSNELGIMFERFRKKHSEIDQEDYRFWIWDIMDGSIDTERAVQFLQFLEIVKTDLQSGSEIMKRTQTAP